MRLTRGLLVALSIASFANAHAEFATGNKVKAGLERWERREDHFDATYYAGYVIGVFDSKYTVTVCPPDGVTVGQVTSLVLKYLREHPEVLHLAGDIVVATALTNSWRCKSATTPPASPPPQAKKSPPKPQPPAPREKSPF